MDVQNETTQPATKLIPVFLEVDTAGQESKSVKFEVRSGVTVVSNLKEELGVPAAATLWLEKGSDGEPGGPLQNTDSLEVKPGMHFEAIEGGGIS